MTGDYEQYLRSWIEEVLAVPNELLNSLPVCPFAYQAMIHNQIQFARTSDYVIDITKALSQWNEDTHALVFVCDDDCDPIKFAADVKALNNKFMLDDLVLLEDHTQISEPFHGISFNNGRYNVIIAQRLQRLNDASRHLCRQGYYVNWSDVLYDDVVRWRFETGPSSS